MNTNNHTFLTLAWFNAGIGTILSTLEPYLANVAYIGSIIGSGVYIYVTLKNNNKK